MKTIEDDFGADTLPERAFPKEIIEKILPNVGKIKSPLSNRGQHYKLRYKAANRLNSHNTNDKTTDSSIYAFVVAWQRYY